MRESLSGGETSGYEGQSKDMFLPLRIQTLQENERVVSEWVQRDQREKGAQRFCRLTFDQQERNRKSLQESEEEGSEKRERES